MSNLQKSALVISVFVFLLACKEKQPSNTIVENEISQELDSIPGSWIENRVKNAESRFNASEAGKVIWNAMEAHGGLANWYSNGPLGFRFNYQPLDGDIQRDSYQVVDIWRNRSVHTSTKDSTSTYGWSGTEAWLKTKDSTALAYDTKFWAMTPLYLMGFPFVLDGEGVNLELLPQSNYLGKANNVVKITFSPGTGDAPDDYYILHFDAETHQLIGTRYIVSYPEYFKNGEHLPEKFMKVGPMINIEGLLLPSQLKTHWTVDGLPGDYLTFIEISDYEFKGPLPKTYFDRPKGAKKL